MSSSTLEALHHLCELERTQILQSLAPAVLKILQEFYYQVIDRILNITKEIYYGTTHVLEKHHHYMFFNIIGVIKESLYFTKK